MFVFIYVILHFVFAVVKKDKYIMNLYTQGEQNDSNTDISETKKI